MRSIIQASNARSAQMGIVLDQVASRVILSSDALLDKILQHRELILATEPFMNQLYNFVKGSNFIAILIDAGGCILSMIGDEAILQEAYALKMVPGAYMDEGNIGTNAMGTALHLGEPVQVSGREHVIEAYYRWTCSCAVIRDENQKIIGALDLTGYKEGAHCHTLGMVVAAVHAIENTLKLQGKNRAIEVQSTLAERVMEMVEAGIVICDERGKVQHANEHALKLLGASQDIVCGKPLWHVVKDYEELMLDLNSTGSVIERQVHLTAECVSESVQMTATPVSVGANGARYFVLRLDQTKLPRRLKQSIADSQALYTFDKIIGNTKKMQDLTTFAKQVANSRSTVLITGESGTGKEVFAHAIHNHSERRQKPFVVVNCGSIPSNLIESELFGYDEGAFTGAKKGGNPGKFEIADGGTLLLDEIGDMPVSMQTRLLRVLQEGIVCRVGSHQQRAVDVRLIAATNRDLSEAVAKGRFRLDLFYRLNVLPMHLPPLKERREDIGLLADFFVQRLSRRMYLKPIALTEIEIAALKSYSWPGNIRELENAMEWRLNTHQLPMHILGEPNGHSTMASTVNSGAVFAAVPENQMPASERMTKPFETLEAFDTLETFEKQYIQKVYQSVDGNLAKAAKILGIARNTLYKKLSVD